MKKLGDILDNGFVDSVLGSGQLVPTFLDQSGRLGFDFRDQRKRFEL